MNSQTEIKQMLISFFHYMEAKTLKPIALDSTQFVEDYFKARLEYNMPKIYTAKDVADILIAFKELCKESYAEYENCCDETIEEFETRSNEFIQSHGFLIKSSKEWLSIFYDKIYSLDLKSILIENYAGCSSMDFDREEEIQREAISLEKFIDSLEKSNFNGNSKDLKEFFSLDLHKILLN